MSIVMDIFDLAKTLSESDRARILEKEVLFRYWDNSCIIYLKKEI